MNWANLCDIYFSVANNNIHMIPISNLKYVFVMAQDIKNEVEGWLKVSAKQQKISKSTG